MSKLDKLNLTQDEVKRFHSAMDDPEFRRLLSEYAAEISDPRAREEQDAFLRMVEAKAKAGEADSLPGGMQIPKGHKLLSPTPVQCIKVVVPQKSSGGQKKNSSETTTSRKVFINICTCDAVKDMSTTKVEAGSSAQGSPGHNFSLPYSLSHARSTKDAHGQSAGVYDFVISPVSWDRVRHHPRLLPLVHGMAAEAIALKEGVAKDSWSTIESRTVLKNVVCKGGTPPPRLFTLENDKDKDSTRDEATSKQNGKPPKNESSQKKEKNQKGEEESKQADNEPALKQVSSKQTSSTSTNSNKPKGDPRETPSYTVVHRGYFDLSKDGLSAQGSAPVGSSNVLRGQFAANNDDDDFALMKELSKDRPKEIVLRIDLPNISKVSEVNLDTSRTSLLLTSACYYLHLNLPYPIQQTLDGSTGGSAAWSAKTKKLTITLPVDSPTREEIERYKKQRSTLVDAQRRRAEQEEREKKEEEAREREQEERERKEREEREEEERKRKQEEEEQRRISQQQSIVSSSTAATSSTSPSSTSSSSPPSSSSSSMKHVRFSFSGDELLHTQPDSPFIVPERDGPTGPKPVKLVSEVGSESASSLLSDSPTGPQPTTGKGHKRKHIPGTEGPEEWTGIGVESSLDLIKCFPKELHKAPSTSGSPKGNTNQKGTSPRHGPNASPRHGPAATSTPHGSGWFWPAYTYSQSVASIVLVIKIKGVVQDSVQLHVKDIDAETGEEVATEDSPTNSSGVSSGNIRSVLDLYFIAQEASGNGKGNNHHSSTIKRPYRLFLPLARRIVKAKVDVSPKNLLVNLVKVSEVGVKSEWDHLTDYSVLGEFDPVLGTPLTSPAAAPHQSNQSQSHGGLEELSLGEAHIGPVASSTRSSSSSSNDNGSSTSKTTLTGILRGGSSSVATSGAPLVEIIDDDGEDAVSVSAAEAKSEPSAPIRQTEEDVSSEAPATPTAPIPLQPLHLTASSLLNPLLGAHVFANPDAFSSSTTSLPATSSSAAAASSLATTSSGSVLFELD